MQSCLAVKLQERFVDFKTSPDFEGEEIMTEFAFLQVIPFLKKIKCLHSVLTIMHCLYLTNAFTFA